MWFKSYFVKPRNDNRFAMQRRASALNSHMSGSKHSLNGGTLSRGQNSVNSNVFNQNSTVITGDGIQAPKLAGMSRLQSTSQSYNIATRSSPNVLNKTIVIPINNAS